MTERDLRKLNRLELLEMLLALSKENDRLTQEVEQLKKAAEDRRIDLEQAGSIADAAMAVSGVFQAAQEAAELYLTSVRAKESECEAKVGHMLEEAQRSRDTMLEEAQRSHDAMLEEARQSCDAMLAQTRRDIDQWWQRFHEQMQALHQTVPGLDRMTWGDEPREGEDIHV